MRKPRRARRPGRTAATAAAFTTVLLVGSVSPAYASFAAVVAGGPMAVATAALTAPTGLAASNPCTSATTISTALSWTASTAAATGGYTVLRSSSPGSGYTQVATLSGIDTTTYTDTITHPAVADSLYVAVKSASGMDVVSMATNAKTANSGGPNLKNPTAIAVTPDGTGNAVTPITVATNTAGSPITIGFPATAIAISPDGTTAWVDGQSDMAPITLATSAVGTLVSVPKANFQGIAMSPNGCWVYGADASANNQVVPVNAVTGVAGTAIKTDTSPEDIATAYSPVTFYYEVEGTRNLWTSPAAGPASQAFGQPHHSS